MTYSVLLGTSHFTKQFNKQSSLYFRHNLSLNGYGIDTYFLRIARFVSRHKQSKWTWLIEIPCPGRYHEWINEDKYEYGDFTKKEFEVNDYSYFYSKTQNMNNWLAIEKQTASIKKKIVGGMNAVRTLSKVKVFSNERLEFDDIITKCLIIDGYLKNQGHTVNWVSVNSMRDLCHYSYLKKLTKPMHLVLKYTLRDYICNKHNEKDYKTFTIDGSHFKEEIWTGLWPVIIKGMQDV
jgi:hypothetical protein